MRRSNQKTKVILRLELPGGGIVGPGKADLLERVDRLGSISEAARDMHMSYAQAWKLVETMNQTFGRPVVHTQQGGRKGGGAKLTPTGRKILQCYRSIQQSAAKRVGREVRRIERLASRP